MEKLQPTKQNDMVANKSNYKVSKNKHTSDEPMKIKTNKYNRGLRYITSTWRTLMKLKNTKNWTWRNTNWNIPKMNTTEHKANMNITKIDKYKKTEQQFYNGDKTDMKTT